MYRVVWTLIMALTCPFALGHSERNLNVNSATQAELEQLRGVGPQLSTRILTAREARPFSDWDDLRRRVTGLGPAQSARLSWACSACWMLSAMSVCSLPPNER